MRRSGAASSRSTSSIERKSGSLRPKRGRSTSSVGSIGDDPLGLEELEQLAQRDQAPRLRARRQLALGQVDEEVEDVDRAHRGGAAHRAPGGEVREARQVAPVRLDGRRRQLALDPQVVEELLDALVQARRHAPMLDATGPRSKFWSFSFASSAGGLRPPELIAGGFGNPLRVPIRIASSAGGLRPPELIAGGFGNPMGVPIKPPAEVQLVDGAVQEAVGEGRPFGGAVALGQLDGLVQHDVDRDVQPVAQLVERQADDVAIDDRHAFEPPVARQRGQQLVDLAAPLADAAHQHLDQRAIDPRGVCRAEAGLGRRVLVGGRSRRPPTGAGSSG